MVFLKTISSETCLFFVVNLGLSYVFMQSRIFFIICVIKNNYDLNLNFET